MAFGFSNVLNYEITKFSKEPIPVTTRRNNCIMNVAMSDWRSTVEPTKIGLEKG